jgi:hypothetical protein
MNDLDVLMSMRPPTDQYDPAHKEQLRTFLFGSDELDSSLVKESVVIANDRSHRDGPRSRIRVVVSIAAAIVVLATGATIVMSRHRTTTTITTPRPADDSVAATVVSEATLAVSDALAPLDLPDGLVIWHVTRFTSGAVAEPPFVEQLFGRYDDSGVVTAGVWIRVQSTPNELVVGDDVPTVTLRDQLASVLPAATVMLRWVEQGRQIDVEAQGLSQAEVISMLDGLEWRADSADGFLPSSSPLDLALIAEDSSEAHSSWPVTTYIITEGSGPSDDELMNGAVAMVTIGPQRFVSLPPWQIMQGVRQADGSIVVGRGDTWAEVIRPDGLQIQVHTQQRSSEALPDPALVTRILESLQPTDGTTAVQLQTAMSQRLEQAPPVKTVGFGDATIQLRGGTVAVPQSLCLTFTDATTCRAVNPAVPPNTSALRSMIVDGRWFVIGFQPAAEPAPGLYEWSPNLPDVVPADVRVVHVSTLTDEARTYWMAEIPTGIDNVGFGEIGTDGSLTTGFPLSESGLRRPPG